MWHLTKKLTLSGVLAFVVLSWAPNISAQIVYGQPAAGNMQFIYYSWTTDTDGDEKTISQLMIPISGFVPVRENFDLSFFVANSSSSFTSFDTESKLSGLGDFRVQANHSFLSDQLLVSGSVNLPTGKKELDGEQSSVLFALSQNYLDLPMRQFGEGFGFTLLAGGAMELKEGLRGGASMSYQYVGSYTPYVGTTGVDTLGNTTSVDFEGYDPGDVFSINGGVDLERGSMLWSVDMSYSQYLADKKDDFKTFRQSRQFDWRFRGTYVSKEYQLTGLMRYVWRGKNRIYNDLGEWESARQLYGNEFLIAGGLTYPFSEKWFVAPSLDLRMIADNELESGSSSLFGFGSTLGRNISESANASVGLKLYSGTADGGDTDISGYNLTFSLTASL